MTKVKICGLTNLEDAQAAIDMGADLLGFNFFKGSKRYISPEKALAIINKLPTFVDTVGIFVNADAAHIQEIAEQGFLNWIQLHGEETPEFCDSLQWLNARTIKALRVKAADDIEIAESFYTDAILLDAYHPDEYGGTGHKFDWDMITNINKRIFLAGGITPENAVKAIEVGVYGIDICSSIESSPGKKDHEKMARLFENIKHVRN
jgi:phosphoribosylanthranilate isomerase